MAGRHAGSCLLTTRRRDERGSIIPFALVLLVVLIPIGAIAYDACMAREQFNQLQAATDAAALAAATYLNDPNNSDNTGTAQQVGLAYFQQNMLQSGSLSGATFSSTALSDSPMARASTFNLVANANGTVTAQSAFGLQPFLLKFLGTFPLHASSTAGALGTAGLTGDVALVVDLSASMTAGSNITTPPHTSHYVRVYHKATATTPAYLTYNVAKPPSSYLPQLGNNLLSGFGLSGRINGVIQNAAIPDPAQVAFAPNPTVGSYTPVTAPPQIASAPELSIDPTTTPMMYAALNAYAQAWSSNSVKPAAGAVPTIEDVKAALLIESKRGDLENSTVYNSSNAGISCLQYIPGFSPEPGYQAEYQKLALTLSGARQMEIEALHSFIDQMQASGSSNAHWSVIGFGASAPGGKPTPPAAATTLDTANPQAFHFPEVTLDPGANNASQVEAALDMATLTWGTDTPEALQEAVKMLNGSGHTKGSPKTIILLTDGMPTLPGSYAAAKLAGQSGIRLVVIGIFLSNYAWPDGWHFVQELAKKTGNGSQAFKVGDGNPSPPSSALLSAAQGAINDILLKVTKTSGVVALQ